MSNEDVVELEVTSLAAGGDGVARWNQLAVFIPRTATGDVVRARVRAKANFARGAVEAVLRASPNRVEAPCIHFVRDQCGGCQWQHLSIHAQRDAKTQLVVDAFARIARTPIARPEISGDEHTLAYRRTLSFTVRGNSGKRHGGFHAAASPDVIVPIGRCLIAHADIQNTWDVLRRHLALLPRVRAHVARSENDAKRNVRRRRDGREVHDDLRVSLRRLGDEAIALVVEGGTMWRDETITTLAAQLPMCRGIWWKPESREARLVWEPVQGTDDTARDANAAAALDVAASFVQVNEGVAALMHTYVYDLVQRESPTHVIDAYAGTGRLAIALTNAVGAIEPSAGAPGAHIRVTAIERDVRASAYAAAQFTEPSRAVQGAVEEQLAHALPADVVVLNPPRGGVDRAVTELLSAAVAQPHRPRLLVYVSCDPATLARDVARLTGWRVEHVHCFDMFPQTAHVETVCVLRPEAL